MRIISQNPTLNPDTLNNVALQPFINRIHHGNCIQLMRILPKATVDLIVTDPPYLVNYRSRDGRTITGDAQGNWLQPAFAEMYRVLKQDSFTITFYGWNSIDKFMTSWKQAGFYAIAHFVFAKHYGSKTGFTEARHECAYLLAKGRPEKPRFAPKDLMQWGKCTGNRLHPTQKPTEPLHTLVGASSEKGNIVLDPFSGSDSTLYAAKELDRSYIGMEIDKTYHSHAVNRLTSN